MKKIIIACLAILLLLTAVSVAAATATATDMRLESTEGTVSIQNANGRAVSLRDGMKLYSGYTVSTGAKSYAYISLDDSKVVKLDANSEAEIRKQDSNLEILVKSGNLFFNVKQPVSSGETMNIRTSTMVTGIRGTSGIVSVTGAEASSVAITDGSVQVTLLSDASQTRQVNAGQAATSDAGDGPAMDLSDLTEEDIPGFVAQELKNDAELSQRVADASGLDVDAIIDGADERLAQDQQEAQEAQDAIDASLALREDEADSSDLFSSFPQPTPGSTTIFVNPSSPGSAPDEPDTTDTVPPTASP